MSWCSACSQESVHTKIGVFNNKLTEKFIIGKSSTNIFSVLENSAGNPSNEEVKSRTHQKSQLRGRIASPGTGRVPKLSCFWKKLFPSSLK